VIQYVNFIYAISFFEKKREMKKCYKNQKIVTFFEFVQKKIF
jgi:hypothetical protein